MSIRNNVSLIGNLGGNPKVTTLESGTIITEFNLATNEYFRDREGNRQSRTMWHNVKAFGKQAEILGQYLTSGSMVAVEGRLSYRKWIDKHEQTRTSTEIITEDFTFLSPKDQTQASPPAMVTQEPVAKSSQAKSRKAKGDKSKTVSKARPSPSATKGKPQRKSTRPRRPEPVSAPVHDEDLPF